MKLGGTGEFPRGSLGKDDEGELNLAVAHKPTGEIIITFGKSVAWIGMEQDDAIALAKAILKHAGAKKVEITL